MEEQNTTNAQDTAKKAEEPKKEKKKTDSKIDLLQKEIEDLKKQLQESNDKYLRMLAEYDNYRRRSVKEKEGTWADAVADTIQALLPIADNLDRAVKAEGDDASVRKGLEMTMNSLTAMFSKLGIETFGTIGDSFDPNLHNAVMHEDNPDLGENVISDVFQIGYKKGDKIIRFAMVKVAN